MRVQKREMRKPETQMFVEGEIWYYYNPNVRKTDYIDKNKNDDVLSNRPVLILSNSNGPSNKYVTVCEITHSTNQAGFIINLSPETQSIIMPHQMHTIKTYYLAYRVSALTSDALSEVKKAVAYHMGLSDEVPPYYVYTEEGEDRFTTKYENGVDASKRFISTSRTVKSTPTDEDLQAIKLLNSIISAMPKNTDFSEIDLEKYNTDYGKIVDCLSMEELLVYSTGTKRSYIQKRFGVSYYKANGILVSILNKQRQLRELLKIKIESGAEVSEIELKMYNTFNLHINDMAIH